MKKAVLREYLKNREVKASEEATNAYLDDRPMEKPKKKAKKGDK